MRQAQRESGSLHAFTSQLKRHPGPPGTRPRRKERARALADDALQLARLAHAGSVSAMMEVVAYLVRRAREERSRK